MQYESRNPQQGYCVTIETAPTLQAKITLYGGKRSTKLLSDMPENQSEYVKPCVFCQYSQNNFTDARIFKKFNDKSYAVTSLSHQVLVIPEKHYDNIFSVQLEEQISLLKNILIIRNNNLDKIERLIEFYCGSQRGKQYFTFMVEQVSISGKIDDIFQCIDNNRFINYQLKDYDESI